MGSMIFGRNVGYAHVYGIGVYIFFQSYFYYVYLCGFLFNEVSVYKFITDQ